MHLLRHTFVGIILLILITWSTPAFAQDGDWQEVPTDYFVILYTSGNEAVASSYAGFVDEIYEELAAIFNHRTQTPLTMRLYPTLESYQEVNPLARNMPGVVAHADFRRRELVVVLTQTQSQTAEGIENNVRHELTHIIAADLSGNRLNTGFHEGLAQYLEHPTEELERKIQLLTLVRDQGLLIPWSEFEDRSTIYSNPEISYPQTLSVVAFLVDQYGFAAFRDFLTISARSSGYRSALERAYGLSPTDLETAWRDWLPDYLNGGYLQHGISGYDLSYPRQLLEQGRYTEAQAELEHAINLLETNIQGSPDAQQQAALDEARELQQAIQKGVDATALATQARTALEARDYNTAAQLVEQARAAYAEIGDTRQEDVLATYAEHAARGLRAQAQLSDASGLSRILRFPAARTQAAAAAADFAAVGDAEGMQRALRLRASLDRYQRIGGMLFLVVGGLSLGLSILGRFYGREAEVW